MKKFASYGSLRKGFWNHLRFGLGEPLATTEVFGEMYVNPSLGYPHLYEATDEAKLGKPKFYEAEIYEVEDKVYDSINNMEIWSGYYPKEVIFPIGDDKESITATVWFAEPKENKDPKHYIEEYSKKFWR